MAPSLDEQGLRHILESRVGFPASSLTTILASPTQRMPSLDGDVLRCIFMRLDHPGKEVGSGGSVPCAPQREWRTRGGCVALVRRLFCVLVARRLRPSPLCSESSSCSARPRTCGGCHSRASTMMPSSRSSTWLRIFLCSVDVSIRAYTVHELAGIGDCQNLERLTLASSILGAAWPVTAWSLSK
jgi:hypothetical protein